MSRSTAERIRAHRARRRAAGYRLVQRWVIDTRDPAFLRRLDEGLRRMRASPEEREWDEIADLLAAEPWNETE